MSKSIITDYVFTFSKENEPVAHVRRKESLIFKTLDCFCNQVESEDQLLGEIDFDKANPATGPVYLEEAEPGDILVAKIKRISTADVGVMATIPDLGPLGAEVEARTKIVPIKNNQAHFNDLVFPVNNMIGVIGTAPAEGAVPCGMWGDHGGNMDNKMIGEGTTIYLPVNVPGALFQCGDLHAAMGDGEICGTGVEVRGEVEIEFDLIKGQSIKRPVHETKDKWYTIASAETYDEALYLATRDMAELIVANYDWDMTDTYMYLSAQGDIEIAQGVKPSPGDMVVRLGVPKRGDKPLLNIV